MSKLNNSASRDKFQVHSNNSWHKNSVLTVFKGTIIHLVVIKIKKNKIVIVDIRVACKHMAIINSHAFNEILIFFLGFGYLIGRNYGTKKSLINGTWE